MQGQSTDVYFPKINFDQPNIQQYDPNGILKGNLLKNQGNDSNEQNPYEEYIQNYGGTEIASNDMPTWTPHDVRGSDYNFDKTDLNSVGSMQQFLTHTVNPQTGLPYYSDGIDLKWGDNSQKGYDAYMSNQIDTSSNQNVDNSQSVDSQANKAINDSNDQVNSIDASNLVQKNENAKNNNTTVSKDNQVLTNDSQAQVQEQSGGNTSWSIPKLGGVNEQGQKTLWNFPVANTLINAYRNITGTQPEQNNDPNMLGDAIANQNELTGQGSNDLKDEIEEVEKETKNENPFAAFKWDKPTYSSWDSGF